MIALAEHASELGTVTVLESKETRARLYKLGGVFQSEADANGVSTVAYIHAIFGLIRQTSAKRVLMIGCGGGTLGTMLSRAGYGVTIVDTNPIAFVFARRYFGLPRDVECHVADGHTHLALTRERYDVIVLDAYDGDVMPEQFRSGQFLALARGALRSQGCLLVNIHTLDDRDIAAHAFAAALVPHFRDVRILDRMGEPNRNTIVAAGNVNDFVAPRLELAPMGPAAAAISEEFGCLRFR